MTCIDSNRQSNLGWENKPKAEEKDREKRTGEGKMQREGRKTPQRPASMGSHGVPGDHHPLDSASSGDRGRWC